MGFFGKLFGGKKEEGKDTGVTDPNLELINSMVLNNIKTIEDYAYKKISYLMANGLDAGLYPGLRKGASAKDHVTFDSSHEKQMRDFVSRKISNFMVLYGDLESNWEEVKSEEMVRIFFMEFGFTISCVEDVNLKIRIAEVIMQPDKENEDIFKNLFVQVKNKRALLLKK